MYFTILKEYKFFIISFFIGNLLGSTKDYLLVVRVRLMLLLDEYGFHFTEISGPAVVEADADGVVVEDVGLDV